MPNRKYTYTQNIQAANLHDFFCFHTKIKAKAVATEDYATAKKVKAVEGELKNLSAQLAKLVSQLCITVMKLHIVMYYKMNNRYVQLSGKEIII